MTISRLTSFTPEDVTAMDRLMHELSPTSDCNTERLTAAIADENCRLYVAREESQIIGTATLCIALTPEFTLGFIEAVVVLPEHRGKHIATNLMQTLIQEARTTNLHHLHLTSNPLRLSANRMYLNMGFKQKRTNCYEREVGM